MNGKSLDQAPRPGLPQVTPAARVGVPRNDPYGFVPDSREAFEPGGNSRIGPNGATWADPAGRHPGVDHGDLYRLPKGHPSHPDNVPITEEGRPAPPRRPGTKVQSDEPRPQDRNPPTPTPSPRTPPPRPPRPPDTDEPLRKLWHASPGSSGR